MSAIEQRARELPVAARLYTRQTGRCAYRRASVTSAEGEPLVRLADVLSMITALTLPDGFVLVPVEPTEAMVDAGRECGSKFVYERMIAARPEVP